MAVLAHGYLQGVNEMSTLLHYVLSISIKHWLQWSLAHC